MSIVPTYDELTKFRRLAARLYRQFVHPVRWLLLAAVLGGLIVLNAAPYIRPLFVRKVVLYTSTATSSSQEYGEHIRKRFAPPDGPWFLRYDIEVRTSDGFAENRRRVQTAAPGTLVIGFDQDGYEPPENVRALVPMSDVILHVVTRHQRVAGWRLPGTTEPALAGLRATLDPDWRRRPTFGDLLRQADDGPSGRRRLWCYLGPRGSGTRQLAREVLAHYGVDPDQVDVGDHLGWDTAYEQLRRDEGVDFVFDASDLGATKLGELARLSGREADPGRRLALVGLDDVAGLVAGQRHLKVRDIPAGTYGRGNGFDPQPAQSIATQRVIICPSALGTGDAYYLTAGIRAALLEKVELRPWGAEAAQRADGNLIYPLHPGAEDYRAGRAPWWWRAVLDNWLVVGGTLLLTGFGYLTRTLANRPPRARLVRAADREVRFLATDTNPREVLIEVWDALTPPGRLTVNAFVRESQPDGVLARVKVLPETPAPNQEGRTLLLERTPGRFGRASVEVVVEDDEGKTARLRVGVDLPGEPSAGGAAGTPVAPPAPVAERIDNAAELAKLAQAVQTFEEDRADAGDPPTRADRERMARRGRELADLVRAFRESPTLADDLRAQARELGRRVQAVRAGLRVPG